MVGAGRAEGLAPLLRSNAWFVAEHRSASTYHWLTNTFGSQATNRYPRFAETNGTPLARWLVATSAADWHAGFWPGTLWMLAQRQDSPAWLQRAVEWSQGPAHSTNNDHDIGFIVLGSAGKGLLYHDALTDPEGAYRSFATNAILRAAGLLNARFNMGGVPAGFIKSWNFMNPYPVIVDNLMNLELLLWAYELSGRDPEKRVWFNNALTHARSSIARHLRPDGSTYHVVQHYDSGPNIGQVFRKTTHQGYAAETTWSRGQAWALYGFTTVYRYAQRDPETDASDILDAARRVADYFISRLPHYYTNDMYNHRVGDFVPPADFDAALGEPVGPWNGTSGPKPPKEEFTHRDSSAAAIAASGLLELCLWVTDPAEQARYFQAAVDILHCLITYDGNGDGQPDYLCAPGQLSQPGILDLGARFYLREYDRSFSYGDYYFLEALVRLETLRARELAARTQQVSPGVGGIEYSFHCPVPAPAARFMIEKTVSLTTPQWIPVAWKTGNGPWAGPAAVEIEPVAPHEVRVRVLDSNPQPIGFFRLTIRSVGGL